MDLHLFTTFAAGCKSSTFFGLKPWYYYLPVDGNCNITAFDPLPTSSQSGFAYIALALIDDLLIVAGLIAVAFVLYGGILYLTSQGSPDQTQKAQGTIQNALVGLVIAILSIAVIRFLGSRLG